MAALATASETRVARPDGIRLWRTLLRGAAGMTCDWCDERGRLALYTWGTAARTTQEAGAYCSLHCWGQRHGFVEL